MEKAVALDYDRIIRKFADIIGKPVDETYRFVERLSEQRGLGNFTRTEPKSAARLKMNQNLVSVDPDLKKKAFLYFTGSAMLLDPIDIDDSGTTVRSRGAVMNSVKKIGKGGYGTVFGSTSGKNIVYKQFIFDDGDLLDYEDKIRNMYVETFIQTVLASDPDVGQYVCMPKKMYKSSTLRGFKTDPSAKYGFEPPRNIVVYLVMEPLQYTFKTLVEKRYSRQINHEWFGPVLFQLGYTLSVLKDRYGFNHGDLHTDNVMFDAGGNLKLIDFGFSCITVNGRVFKELSSWNTGCFQGYDLAIFFYDFWNTYFESYFVDTSVRKLFNSGAFSDLSNSSDKFNLFEYGSIVGENLGTPGHFLFYNDVEGTLRDTKKNEKLLNHLSKVEMLNPKFLMNHFQKYHTGPVRHTHPSHSHSHSYSNSHSASVASGSSPKASNYFIPALNYPGLVENPPLRPGLESPEFSPTFALSPSPNSIRNGNGNGNGNGNRNAFGGGSRKRKHSHRRRTRHKSRK